MNGEITGRLLSAAVLAIAAGVIVVGGGSALAYFAGGGFGTTLGVVHLLLGIVLLSVAIGFWRGINGFRTLTLLWSGVVISYSCTAEAVVLNYRILPPGPDAGSLVGTGVAVGMLVAAVFLSWEVGS
jgi:hypothetical protein